MFNNAADTRHSIDKSRGIDIIHVTQARIDENGLRVTGIDQHGRKINDIQLNASLSPLIIPENGDAVFVERIGGVRSHIRGKALSSANLASADLQQGDYAILGPKRVLIFTDDFRVRNRAILDELTNGGGQNLLENSGFEGLVGSVLTDKFTLTQGITNTVAWQTNGMNANDGSFLFTINIPNDPVKIKSKISHIITGGDYTLSTYVKTENWDSDTVVPKTKLSVFGISENKETLVQTPENEEIVYIDNTTPEGNGQVYINGSGWFRPYNSPITIPTFSPAPTDRYVAVFGFETRGHYKTQLNVNSPSPHDWVYLVTDIQSGINDCILSQGGFLRSFNAFANPYSIDYRLTQENNISAILLTKFIDEKNFEGFLVSPGVVSYVSVVNNQVIQLDTTTSSVVNVATFYRVKVSSGGVPSISASVTRGASNLLNWTPTVPIIVANSVGVFAKLGNTTIAAIDIFQPYTVTIDNVQLERGATLSGWENSTNEQVNINDFINQINDLPQDGSTIIADRIGAGTIVGREIIVANKPPIGPPTRRGILRSSNFDIVPIPGELASLGLAGAANEGWLILGDGDAYFQQITAGKITSGGFINNSSDQNLLTDNHVVGSNLVHDNNNEISSSANHTGTINDATYTFIPSTNVVPLDPGFGVVSRDSFAYVNGVVTLRQNVAGSDELVVARVYYGTNPTDPGKLPASGLFKVLLPGSGLPGNPAQPIPAQLTFVVRVPISLAYQIANGAIHYWLEYKNLEPTGAFVLLVTDFSVHHFINAQ